MAIQFDSGINTFEVLYSDLNQDKSQFTSEENSEKCYNKTR